MLKDVFSNGTPVVTNEEYFKKFKRRVHGIVVNPPELKGPLPEGITLVECVRQEGAHQIKDYNGSVVAFMTCDLKSKRPLH